MTDWKARAEREAAAIMAETGFYFVPPNADTVDVRTRILSLMAIAWLQGANYADHKTLTAIEDAFDELRAAL